MFGLVISNALFLFFFKITNHRSSAPLPHFIKKEHNTAVFYRMEVTVKGFRIDSLIAM